MAGGDPSLNSLWSIEWSFALSNRLWRNTIPDRHRSLHVARDYLNRIWGGVPRRGWPEAILSHAPCGRSGGRLHRASFSNATRFPTGTNHCTRVPEKCTNSRGHILLHSLLSLLFASFTSYFPSPLLALSLISIVCVPLTPWIRRADARAAVPLRVEVRS